MKNLLLFVLTITCLNCVSQDITPYNEYIWNKQLLNPAYSGNDRICLMLTDRHQWLNVDGAPQTQTLGIDAQINTKSGVSAILFNDAYGINRQLGSILNYAYKVQISKELQISFGLGVAISNYNIDLSKIKAFDANDPLLLSINSNKTTFDANFGLGLNYKKFKAGISSVNLLQSEKGFTNSFNDKQLRRIYINSSYFFNLNEYLDAEPIGVIKLNESFNPEFDLGIKAILYKNIWLSGIYRTKKTAIIQIGVKIKNIEIGYGFDYTSSEIYTTSFGTHEFMLSFCLDRSKKKKFEAISCPAY